MSKRTGGGAIRIAVAATSAVRRAGLESIIRSHAEFYLAGSFGAVASLLSFARSTELDVIVIDTDSIRDLLLEPTSDAAAIVLLTEVTEARSISRLLRSGVRAILSRESDPDNVLSAIYASYDGLVLLSIPTAESLAAVYGDQPLEVEAELSEEISSTKISRLVSVSPSIPSSSTSARFSTSWALPPAPKRLHWESGVG
jgi:DNA-binding NarL/FixJ family response regulator